MLLNMVAHLLCALTILLMEVCLITITMLYSLISKCQQNSNYKMEILLSVWQPITVGAFCGIYRSKEPIVKWLFQTNKYRRYIWNSLQGGNGAIANLNGEDILNMSFSIPNAPIKDTCVKMLTSVDSALGNNMSLCALYTLQKQHLLRQMFI